MKRPAFLIADALAGMALLAAISTVLIVAVSTERTAQTHLSDDRAAVRLAEAEMSALQAGGPPPVADGHQSVEVRDLNPPAATAGGQRWVEVLARVNGREQRLVGLVPAPPTTRPTTGGSQ